MVDCTGLCQIQVLVWRKKCVLKITSSRYSHSYGYSQPCGSDDEGSRIHIATYISTSTAAAAEIGAKFTDASKNTKKKKEKKQNEWKMESNCSGTGPHLYECAFVRHFKDEENRMPQTS